MSRMIASGDMTGDVLRSRFAVVRRRLLAVGFGAAAGWGLAAGILVIIVAAWIRFGFGSSRRNSRPLRLSRQLHLPLERRFIFLPGREAASTSASMAKAMDVAAKANGQIISGVDLAMAPAGGSAITQGLARIASRRAVELVGTVPASVAARGGRALRRPFVILSAAILFVRGGDCRAAPGGHAMESIHRSIWRSSGVFLDADHG